MYIADALSRAFPPEIITEDFERDMEEEKYIHLMSCKAYVTDRKLEEVKQHIKKDEDMQQLIHQIQKGWPNDKRLCQPEIREYFKNHEKLTECDGLIYAGHAILIPPALRSDTLHKLHQSHQGIEKTKQLARQSIFWPGMSAQIEDIVSSCPICLRHRNSNAKEPLQPHQLPERPWQRVATDLFDWKGRPHVVLVDYYSRYPEVAELKDTKAKTVINKLKSFFSRHGIPDEVVSDNGPQYTAQEFKDFAEAYGFTHTTISPRFPQSGGLHEKAVQTVKRLLQKINEDNSDPYLALLDYRNTPINGVSPAQALMNRRLRSTLPISPQVLTPKLLDQSAFLSQREKEQTIQKKYFDVGTQPLPPLNQHDQVRMKKDHQSKWQPATVVKQHNTPRSYLVKSEDGVVYRRNRRHLMKVSEEPHIPDEPTLDETPQIRDDLEGGNMRGKETASPRKPPTLAKESIRVSSYGRIIKPNPKYMD